MLAHLFASGLGVSTGRGVGGSTVAVVVIGRPISVLVVVASVAG